MLTGYWVPYYVIMCMKWDMFSLVPKNKLLLSICRAGFCEQSRLKCFHHVSKHILSRLKAVHQTPFDLIQQACTDCVLLVSSSSLSDLWANPNTVFKGTLWVPLHANWSQLVQLFLWSTDTPGEFIQCVTSKCHSHLYFYDVSEIGYSSESHLVCLVRLPPSGVTSGLWCYARLWRQLHWRVHWGNV